VTPTMEPEIAAECLVPSSGALEVSSHNGAGPRGALRRRLKVVTTSLARGTLVGLGLLVMWCLLPVLMGWQSTVVMSGSMSPKIQVGDVVVVRPVQTSQLRPGQVLLVDDPDHAGEMRLHRLVQRRGDELVLRGDANGHEDSSPVSLTAVHGVGTIRVPSVGLPLVWARQGHLMRVIVTGIGVTTLVCMAMRPLVPSSTATADPRAERAARGSGGRRLRRSVQAGASGLMIAAGFMTAYGPGDGLGARAAYSAPTAAAAKVATNAYYRCGEAAAALGATRYYPLQNTTGSVIENHGSEGAAGDGTLVGDPLLDSSGASCSDGRKAVTLDGISQYLTTPQATLTDGITVAGWFRLTAQQGGLLIGFGDAATGASTALNRAIYVTSAGVVTFWASNGSYLYTDSSDPQVFDGQWHFIAETYSSSGVSVQLDGYDYASFPGYGVGPGATGYWRVGYDDLSALPNAPITQHAAAQVAHIGIYDRVLTNDELRQLWATGA
jgi:signal peptidase I